MLGTSGIEGVGGGGGGGGGGHEGVEVAGGGNTTPSNNSSNNSGSPPGGIMAAGHLGDEDRGVSGGGSELFYEGDRSTGGNRWPRQETLALLKIRSDMDVVFRDSSLKGPLWEEVSRKMAELGYHRSSKKCKEKFENVYKYHKRTKEGRVGKADGKTYRFFDQLEALEQHQASLLPPLPPQQPGQPRAQQQAVQAAVPVTMVMPAGTNPPASVTVTSSSPHPINVIHTSAPIASHQHHMNQIPQPQLVSSQPHPQPSVHMSIHHHQTASMPGMSPGIQMEHSLPSSPSATPSSSSSTSSDEELLGRRKRKRKWKDFFERLVKEVIDKQEELQKRFMDAVEKRENDRIAREEAWKNQEVARLAREHEILVQERSMAAAKDAALIAFLQKISDQQQIPIPLPAQAQTPTPRGVAQPQPQTQPQSQPPPPPQSQMQENPVTLTPQQQIPQPRPVTQLPPPTQQPAPVPQQQATLVVANTNAIATNVDYHKSNNGDNQSIHLQPSSSRWPKSEVQALINLRSSLDQKYQENGPKGPLWEEISSAMKKLGYNRNSKRCKEKWENINKYFKKVKESNKKRPEDSKTCPYFHQLDALYREKKIRMEVNSNNNSNNVTPAAAGIVTTAATTTAYGQATAVQAEQQWQVQQGPDMGSDNHEDTDDDGDEEDDDDQGSGYEIVASNAAAAPSTTTA